MQIFRYQIYRYVYILICIYEDMQKTGNLDLYVKDIYILDMQIDRFLVLKTEKEEKKEVLMEIQI